MFQLNAPVVLREEVRANTGTVMSPKSKVRNFGGWIGQSIINPKFATYWILHGLAEENPDCVYISPKPKSDSLICC